MRVLMMTAIYPTTANPAFGAFVKAQIDQVAACGIDIELFVLDGRNRKLMYPRAVVELRRRMRLRAVDVIHAHYSYVGMVARTQRHVPIVVSFLGDDLLGTPGRDGERTRASRVMAAAGRELAERVDAVIVKSREMAELLRRRDVHVIPNGVDFDVFRPIPRDDARAALRLDPAKRYLLFPANPAIPRKNFPLARAVADRLSTTHPDVELLVVHREPQERLALYLNATDVVLFPSHQEGSPNVVKQAMACNAPIVATDVGDVCELFGHAAGFRLAAPDVEPFTRSAIELLSSGTRSEGRAAIGHLTGPAVAGQVIDVYRETLRRRG